STWHSLDRDAYCNLKKATIFTRLYVRHSADQVKSVLMRLFDQHCVLAHHNIILLFHDDQETHTRQQEMLFEMLKMFRMTADIQRSKFDAESPKDAGFEL
ncbi:hypothetical protein NA57DRAFT_13480, partial [Rhizodiscina lignyota]